MRLADFIIRDLDHILSEWEKFASTRGANAHAMSSLALRDHAEQILRAIALDLTEAQSAAEQVAKSRGEAPVVLGAPETAAQTHGLLRAKSGFDINQMTSEFRALRASVLKLWKDAATPDATNLDDVIRFNEAIDQALAESVAFYSASVDRARNLFLGMLGHDMRTPLQAITMTASYLRMLDAGPEVSKGVTRVMASGARMQTLLDDLIGFNRVNLGVGIPVNLTPCDLSDLCADELAQIRAAHPERQIDLVSNGTSAGLWDGPWVHRLVGNLTTNAIKYGSAGAPVRVIVIGEERHAVIEVHNQGPAIDPSALESLFDPLKRGLHHQDQGQRYEGLGLGLYIAREVATAHGGEISAKSDSDGTVFTVRLPRQPRTAEA